MPTAGRLVAAILYGLLAWLVSEMIKPLFPAGMDFGRFSEINALIGVVVGWIVAGSRAGLGWRASVGSGLTASAAVLFWCLFLQSFGEMVRKSLRMQYGGAMDAVVGVFQLMIEHVQVMASSLVIVTLLVGGIVAGLIVEWSARRWD
jgi:hypothetical protein